LAGGETFLGTFPGRLLAALGSSFTGSRVAGGSSFWAWMILAWTILPRAICAWTFLAWTFLTRTIFAWTIRSRAIFAWSVT
jgi:hypothetical protein